LVSTKNAAIDCFLAKHVFFIAHEYNSSGK
jgi:hypothetical protein